MARCVYSAKYGIPVHQLCQMVLFQRKIHPLSQIFYISPHKPALLFHRPLWHQPSKYNILRTSAGFVVIAILFVTRDAFLFRTEPFGRIHSAELLIYTPEAKRVKILLDQIGLIQ